jgi:hypothetical protein
LPWPEVQNNVWQSKDTPAQYLDSYEIREDGTLWHREYDSRFEETTESPLGFCVHQDNEHWAQEDYTGELEIHEALDDAWYSVQFWFRDGVVKDAVYSSGKG